MKITPKDCFMFLKTSSAGHLNPYNQADVTFLVFSGIRPQNGYGENSTQLVSDPAAAMITVLYRDRFSRIRTRSVSARLETDPELMDYFITGKMNPADFLRGEDYPFRLSIREGISAVAVTGRLRRREAKIKEPVQKFIELNSESGIPVLFDLRGDMVRYLEIREPANAPLMNRSGRTGNP